MQLSQVLAAQEAQLGRLYRAAMLKCRNSGRLLPRLWSRSGSRNTGVKRAEVITARLVQDERGWLRLAR